MKTYTLSSIVDNYLRLSTVDSSILDSMELMEAKNPISNVNGLLIEGKELELELSSLMIKDQDRTENVDVLPRGTYLKVEISTDLSNYMIFYPVIGDEVYPHLYVFPIKNVD